MPVSSRKVPTAHLGPPSFRLRTPRAPKIVIVAGAVLRLTRAWLPTHLSSCLLSRSPTRLHTVQNSSELQPQRRMNWHAAAVCARSADTGPCILLAFESAKYVFGAPPGAGRAFGESTQRWARTRAVFAPRVDQDAAGGLASLVMAISGSCTKLDLVGPPGLGYLVTSWRTFVTRSQIEVNVREVGGPPSLASASTSTSASIQTSSEPEIAWRDKNITVWTLPLLPESAASATATPVASTMDAPDAHAATSSNFDALPAHSGPSSSSTGPFAGTSPVAAPDAGVKRPRTPSPPLSSKRHAGASNAPDSSWRARLSRSPPVYSPYAADDARRSPRASASPAHNPYAEDDAISGAAEPAGDSATQRRAKTRQPMPREQVLALMFPHRAPPAFSDLDYAPPPPAPRTKQTGEGKAKAKKAKGKAKDDAGVVSAKPGTNVEAVPESIAPPPAEQARARLVPRPPSYLVQMSPLGGRAGEWAADGRGVGYRSPASPTGVADSVTSLIPPQRPPQSSLIWVVQAARALGKFDVSRAVALGVPNGPLRARLVKGEAVTFEVTDADTPGGKKTVTVQPEEVVAPSVPPAATMILDVPDTVHIASLLAQFREGGWAARFAYAPDERVLNTVFHLLGPGVLADPRYTEFMRTFPADIHHVVSAPQHGPDPVTFVSHAANTLALHSLDADAFPLPYHTLAERPLSDVLGLPSNTTLLRSDTVVHMRPPRAPDCVASTRVDPFHPFVASGPDLEEPVRQAIVEARTAVAAKAEHRLAAGEAPKPGDDLEIFTLGTGSAVPAKFRNVSATLVRIPGHGSVLLECGEGTWGELIRMFGPAAVEDVLRDIRLVHISHVHGDHQLGLVHLLSVRAKLESPPDQPLWVVSVPNMLLNLREAAELEELGIHPTAPGGVRLVNGDALHWQRGSKTLRSDSRPWMNPDSAWREHTALCKALGLSRLATVDMQHGCRCLGAVLTHEDGWRIAFSGDTRPSSAFGAAGAGVDLLIHEATFDDSAEGRAFAEMKLHSTTGEALQIAEQMRARVTLLTHFSCRYPRLSPRAVSTAPGALVLAQDGLRFRLGDAWKLQAYEHVVRAVASKGDEDDEVSAHMMTW